MWRALKIVPPKFRDPIAGGEFMPINIGILQGWCCIPHPWSLHIGLNRSIGMVRTASSWPVAVAAVHDAPRPHQPRTGTAGPRP